MSLQIACLCGCKVTLVAFIWLFSKVCFQMSPQITRPRRCKVTLVAFVWLFSTIFLNASSMYFYQRRHDLIGCFSLAFSLCAFSSVSCLILCILATVAFVCAFPNGPSNFLDQTCKMTFFAFVKFSLLCVFRCTLECYACKTAYSHCLHFFTFLRYVFLGIRIIFVFCPFWWSRIIFVFVFGPFWAAE